MTTVRMLPRNGQTVTGWAGPSDIGGINARRYYSAGAGGYVDAVDLDAGPLGSQGFLAVGNGSGPTTARPNLVDNASAPGFVYLDTTLSLIVVWDGANWRNPVTGATA